MNKTCSVDFLYITLKEAKKSKKQQKKSNKRKATDTRANDKRETNQIQTQTNQKTLLIRDTVTNILSVLKESVACCPSYSPFFAQN